MTDAAERTRAVRQLPGGVGLWIFVLSDLLLFGVFFALFAHDLAADRNVYAQGRATLDSGIGLINTLLLLSGSWAVAMGTRVVAAHRTARYLVLAAVSGLLFLLFKSIEYMHLIAAGHHLTENGFYTWYFVLTGYHALHVLAGIALLSVAACGLRKHMLALDFLEAAGCYWHLVDLLWIGIFSIVYLV